MRASDAELIEMLQGLGDEDLQHLIGDLPPRVAEVALTLLPTTLSARDTSPVDLALELDAGYRERPHLRYLSDRLANAVADVEAGKNRMITISMPPRMGKSVSTSEYFPLALLRAHPDWKIGMISHDSSLVGGWARNVRGTIEENPSLGVTLSKDHGGAHEWSTVQGGGVLARSIGGSVTGKGFKVLILDDVVKDFASAHSETVRNSTWSKWTADFFTRLEGPYLVVALGTRWHEDDFIGRLLSTSHEGDPADWERIVFPAIAEEADVLGRAPGEPLLSPLVDETVEEAQERWDTVRRTVGAYTWASLYQQAPSPAKGAIFDTDWWHYWTTDPAKVTEDGKIVLWDPKAATSGRWTDSWDMTFKGSKGSDFVVGQRWCKVDVTRYLVAQTRERLGFTASLKRVQDWGNPDNGMAPCSQYVHERLVEDKANGTAILDVLKQKVMGLIPINPTDSKEGRARSVTPEIEAGNVRLPHPGDPGNEWVQDFVSEARNFPHGSHDDQIDGMTQYLARVRDPGATSLYVPGRGTGATQIPRNIGQAALTDGTARRPGGR